MSAAWQAFGSFTGLTIAQQDPAADPPAPSPEEVATSTRFFEHGLLPIALYQPDFPALEAAPTRLIVAGGTASRGQFPQRTAVALAARLGTPLMDFPGGHVGFPTEPGEFASVLNAPWRSAPRTRDCRLPGRSGQLSTDRASRSRVTVMFRRFCSSRSSTPDVCVLNAMTDSGRRSSLHSVTRLPDSVGSMR